MGKASRVVIYCENCRSNILFQGNRGFDGTCPACGEFMRRFRCSRCGHMWIPREWTRLPKVCPSCKSPYWCRERVKNSGRDSRDTAGAEE